MNDMPFRPNRDPFATLVSLTAAALSAPLPSRGDIPPATDKTVSGSGSLLVRLDRWIWKARQRDLERALASAIDITDVEARLHDRERKLLQRYY